MVAPYYLIQSETCRQSCKRNLLRFLENGEFRRIGEEQMISVGCQAYFVWHAVNLLERVEARLVPGRSLLSSECFEPLFTSFLRERKGDVLLFVRTFCAIVFCQQLQRPLAKISKRCADYLNQYPLAWQHSSASKIPYIVLFSMLEGDTLEPEHIRLPELSNTVDSIGDMI